MLNTLKNLLLLTERRFFSFKIQSLPGYVEKPPAEKKLVIEEILLLKL